MAAASSGRGSRYSFGEHKGGPTTDGPLRRVDVIGISCYSSRNLLIGV